MLKIRAPLTQQLSTRLGRPIVVYDIEHTGGKKGYRGIVELACITVTGESISLGVDTLINPGSGVEFNHYVTKITGIKSSTVSRSPSWRNACVDYVGNHAGSIWCGFNSRSCDAPIIRNEHDRLGLPEATLEFQLDVMRFSKLLGHSGNLSSLVSRFAPGSAETAHRAMGDVRMTLGLLEAFLRNANEETIHQFLENEQLVPRRKKAKAGKPKEEVVGEPQSLPVMDLFGEVFLSGTTGRHGQPWSPVETSQVASLFVGGTPVEKIAKGHGRTAFAIAMSLSVTGLISKEDALAYRVQKQA